MSQENNNIEKQNQGLDPNKDLPAGTAPAEENTQPQAEKTMPDENQSAGEKARQQAEDDSRTAEKETQPATGGKGKKNKPPLTPEAKKHRNKRRAIIAIVVVVALLGSIFTGLGMLYLWVDKELKGDEDFDQSVLEEVKTSNIPEYTGKNIICGLICGVAYNDATADNPDPQDTVGNTDMILYVMYNVAEQKANFLQIPRDVFVGEDIVAGDEGKINGVYHYSPDPANRMGALAKVLKDQLGLPTDFYIKLDITALRALVDHMGSIEVFVPRDIVDKNTGETLIQEGWRNFTGKEAEQFLRNRNYVDADMTRLLMQQNFYAALYREFKELSPTDLVMWMRILLYYVDVQGLDPIQVGGLAQSALKLEAKDITFVRPPITGAMYGKYFVVCLVPDETADLLNEYFRPEGHVVPVEDLDIQTLPVLENVGKSEAVVRSMTDIREGEEPMPAA